jgi:hypothetical protein
VGRSVGGSEKQPRPQWVQAPVRVTVNLPGKVSKKILSLPSRSKETLNKATFSNLKDD